MALTGQLVLEMTATNPRDANGQALCPKCGGVLRVRDGSANLRGSCSKCSVTVLIPRRP
jgi:hypothetical protein